MSDAQHKTPEEWAQDAVDAVLYEDERATPQAREWHATIQFIVGQAIEAEREACARLLDTIELEKLSQTTGASTDMQRDLLRYGATACGYAAAAIRLRSMTSAPDAAAPSESGPAAQEGVDASRTRTRCTRC